MKAIGIRATKDSFRWALVERTDDGYALLAEGKCPAPKTYDEPDALAWYRERVQTIIRQHQAETAAVRFAETFLRAKPAAKALASMYCRARIEGVIIEALRSAGIPVGVGGWQTISSRMGAKSAKAYTEAGELRGIQIGDKPAEMQEAIAAAVSMLGK
jgi:Holliday junction resolvasome RuvABC endonuclease subunit